MDMANDTVLYISCKITISCGTRTKRIADHLLLLSLSLPPPPLLSLYSRGWRCRCCTITLHCQWYWKYHQNSTFTTGTAVTEKCSPKPLLLLLDNRNNCTPCTHDIFCLYRFELHMPGQTKDGEYKWKWERQDENTIRYFKVLQSATNK